MKAILSLVTSNRHWRRLFSKGQYCCVRVVLAKMIALSWTNFPIFGFVPCRYVHKEKVSGPEGHVIHYELAERALDEDINNRMKEYISKV